MPIELHQVKYRNNIVEQDHRAIKRISRPMLGFQSFRCARILLAGIETMHMIKKGQLSCPDGQVTSAADEFYSLAFGSTRIWRPNLRRPSYVPCPTRARQNPSNSP